MSSFTDVQVVLRRIHMYIVTFNSSDRIEQFRSECGNLLLNIGKATAKNMGISMDELEERLRQTPLATELCPEAEIEFGKLNDWLAQQCDWFTIALYRK